MKSFSTVVIRTLNAGYTYACSDIPNHVCTTTHVLVCVPTIIQPTPHSYSYLHTHIYIYSYNYLHTHTHRDNVSIPQSQITVRKKIADSTLIVGALFWSLVVGFITTVSNLDSLAEVLYSYVLLLL